MSNSALRDATTHSQTVVQHAIKTHMTRRTTDHSKRGVISGILTWLLLGYVLYGWILVDGHQMNEIFFGMLFSLIFGLISFLAGLYFSFRSLSEPSSFRKTIALFLCIGIVPAIWIILSVSRYDYGY